MANTTEQGFTGLAEFSGQIQADFLREWRGQEAYKRANEMRLNSPIIGALLLANELSIRKVKWNFQSEEGEDDPRLELLEDSRKAMSQSWNDFIIEALTFLPFGFSIFEIVYQVVDGKILWRKFAPRGQDTVAKWLFDDTGGLNGFIQRAAPKYIEVTLNMEELLLFRTRVERGNPEGRSILRTAWIPYYFAKHIMQAEAIGLERGLDGFPVIHMPEGATTDESDTSSDASKAAKIGRNIRNDEQAALTLPFGWEVDLLAPGAQSRLDADKVIVRYESRMLMSALAQFLALGQDGVGSLALSKDQTDFFTMSVNAVASIIAETFTKYAIPRLMKLNGYDPDGLSLQNTPAGDIDIVQVSTLLQQAGQFLTWMPDDEEWLRDVAGLPDADIEEIKAERERKQAASDAAMAALAKAREAQANGQQPPAPDKQPPDDNQPPESDQNRAAYYAAVPDAKKRAKVEKAWNSAMDDFFVRQQKRIIKAAKEMKNA